MHLPAVNYYNCYTKMINFKFFVGAILDWTICVYFHLEHAIVMELHAGNALIENWMTIYFVTANKKTCNIII